MIKAFWFIVTASLKIEILTLEIFNQDIKNKF